MTIKAVLFDLDGTLVDSSAVEHLRKARKWKECVANLRKTSVFDGVVDTIDALQARGTKVGIVTTSVSYYAAAICRHHKIRYDTLVCFHDATPKPAPDSFLLALKRFAIQPNEAIGVGDDLPDSLALASAHIRAFGAGWNAALNPGSKWEEVLSKPGEIVRVIG